jgi:cyclopropane fatty-acyl-phospholipid synthase-like methyltransferase
MFNFGRNWRNFSARALDQRSLAEAEQSLQDLLQTERLTGCTLLDLGCGSGLFSIVAARLGAQVTAADVDPMYLQVTENNIRRLDKTGLVTRLVQLSALDRPTMQALGTFDIVYAWGVLHHTGNMWQAIENTLALTEPQGRLVLSIYNKHFSSPLWKVIKRVYVSVPRFAQRLMAVFFAGVILAAKWLVTRRNPLKKERGMHFWYDVVDWIGGYPYEYATAEEIIRFVTARGFEVQRICRANVPTGCNEFVFQKVVF